MSGAFSWAAVVGCALSLVAVGCSDAPVSASPDLECGGEASGTFEADLDPSSPGAATPEAALDQQLRAFIELQGSGEIVDVRDGVGAVVVDGHRVLVLEAHPAPAGGFWADTVHYCEPYFAAIQGPDIPATEAPVIATEPTEGSTAGAGTVTTPTGETVLEPSITTGDVEDLHSLALSESVGVASVIVSGRIVSVEPRRTVDRADYSYDVDVASLVVDDVVFVAGPGREDAPEPPALASTASVIGMAYDVFSAVNVQHDPEDTVVVGLQLFPDPDPPAPWRVTFTGVVAPDGSVVFDGERGEESTDLLARIAGTAALEPSAETIGQLAREADEANYGDGTVGALLQQLLTLQEG